MGKEWKLTELNGSAIVLDTTFTKYPHLKFADFVSTSGNLGCNGFGARVNFSAIDSIKISDIASTQMACPNLDIEHRFMEALKNTMTYKIEGHTLSFNNSKREVIAKLQNITFEN